MTDIIEKIKSGGRLKGDELKRIIEMPDCDIDKLICAARNTARREYGNKIYIRGLIELTNYCRNNCYYCGIRAGNKNCERYRLSAEQVLECCEQGYPAGFRTFVLQGGEDSYYTDEMLVSLISEIKRRHPDCAVTLSLGEKSYDSYRAFFDAGADRYLLRHETADSEHYKKLHPASMSFTGRMRCLADLKSIGYQTGCGFMVGSPYQSVDTLCADLDFIREFSPEMVGIGPFIPHSDTPFRDFPSGSERLTIIMLAIVRLMLPRVLLPATTALGTLGGREAGILAGCNVIMPNLSPASERKKYSLYNGKLYSGAEAAESLALLRESMRAIGYEIEVTRGDIKKQ